MKKQASKRAKRERSINDTKSIKVKKILEKDSSTTMGGHSSLKDEASTSSASRRSRSSHASSGRLEDVFQDEIIKAFRTMTDFKKFARSKNGLCLDEHDIQNIIDNDDGLVDDRKLAILAKWREITAEEATARKIRSLVIGYKKGINPDDSITVCNGMFEIFRNELLCDQSHVFLGQQISNLTDPHLCAIKLFPYNEENLREAEILSELRNHVNVVSIIHADVCYFGPIKYIFVAMELSWNETLQEKLLETRLTERTAIDIAIRIMEALVFIHEHDILHRDLKPGNVLISENMRDLQLNDFGISKRMDDSFQTRQTKAGIGTDGYRGPETYDSENKIGRACDIFSAGVTLAEILSNGKHPYGDDKYLWSYNIKNNRSPDLSNLIISSKTQVENLLRKMLDRNPENRPSAKEVLSELERLKSPQTQPAIVGTVSSLPSEANLMESRNAEKSSTTVIKRSVDRVTVLHGHKREVWTCAWNPMSDLLATGSFDSSAIIWNLREDGDTPSSTVSSSDRQLDLRQLQHSEEVDSIDWNSDGTLLATGARDGCAKIWDLNGRLVNQHTHHHRSISAVKWNRLGNYLLSGGRDKTTTIWDVLSGKLVQRFEFHQGSVLDVDWQSDKCFVSGSGDASIHFCEVGCEKPIKIFQGHSNRVNSVEFDPSRTLLASCSFDKTLKIWAMNKDVYERSLEGHTDSVYKIKWSPAGPGSQNPNQNLLLASASADSTVRLWDPEKGTCLHLFSRHRDIVRSVAFSPNGKLLASGAKDKRVYIWDTHTGQVVQNYEGIGSVSEVSWNVSGTKVGASAKDGKVYVLDVRK